MHVKTNTTFLIFNFMNVYMLHLGLYWHYITIHLTGGGGGGGGEVRNV